MVVAAVLIASCGGPSGTGTDPDGGTAAMGDTAQFCRLWPDVRTTLMGAVTGETTFELLGDPTLPEDLNLGFSDAALEAADAAVPIAVRADWDIAYAAYTSVSDLLYTIHYDSAVIRPVHLTMAFGDAGHEGVVADAEAAVAAIDDWAVEACGDFCSRWPEFEHIVRYQEHFDWGDWRENLDRYLLALAIGDRLVPEAVKADWDTAVDIQRRRMVMFRDNGFSLDVDERTALDQWGVVAWDEAMADSDAALEVVLAWVDDNCDPSLATAGAPGSIAVRLPLQPELANRTVLAVLLPAGTDFAAVRSLDPYLAVTCSGFADIPADVRPEDVPAEMLRSIGEAGEYFEASLCHLIHGQDAAVVAGGVYELFVGAYIGHPGSYELYFAAADFCIQTPVTVNGNTVVDVPTLTPCDLEPLGSADELARRTSPPADAAGRLWIQVDGAVADDGFDFCRMDAVLLPAGTTLNEIGRGDVWPSGTVNFHLMSLRGVDPRDATMISAPGLVPILAMPPSGIGEVMVQPQPQPGVGWDSHFAEPVALAAGGYDLRITQWCAIESSGEEERWCSGVVTVDVAGDTVVPMPELGECP